MRISRSGRSLVAFIALSVAVVGCGDDGSDDATTTGSTVPTTTAASTPPTVTTTTGTTTTGSTDTSSTEQPDTAVWPFAADATRYADPVEAARDFAVTYLGFVDPVVGAFQQGDSRSGEVTIQPDAAGPITTVFVRVLAPDETWWVLGAATDSLQLQSPAALDAISSPVTLSGQSTAFEATVNIEIRQDGTLAPLTEGIVMGGSMGEMGPFSGAFDFATPSASAGAIVLRTLSAEDGSVWEAGVVRVSFAP